MVEQQGIADRRRRHRRRDLFLSSILGAVIGGVFTLGAAYITAHTAPNSTVVRVLVGPLPTVTATASATAKLAAPPAAPNASPTPTDASPSAAASTFLSTLTPLGNGSVRTGAAEVNGVTYDQSLWEPFGGCQVTETASYNLGRSASRFNATVGLLDDSKADSVVNFTVLVDGREVYDSGNLGLGASRGVDVSVADGLRLELKTVFVKGDMGACSEPGYAIWGNASLAR